MVLGRVYEVQDDVAGVTSAASLLAVTVPADMVVQVLQAKITDVDNDSNEQFAGSLQLSSAGPAAGGAAVTPDPLVAGDAASTVVCLSASGAAITGLTVDGREFGRFAAPLVVGYHFNPTDGDGPIIEPGGILVVQTKTAIASTTLHVWLKIREIG